MSQREDGAKCDHQRSEVMVTNQPERFGSTRPHASVWVCAEPGCVVDAMGWVMLSPRKRRGGSAALMGSGRAPFPLSRQEKDHE